MAKKKKVTKKKTASRKKTTSKKKTTKKKTASKKKAKKVAKKKVSKKKSSGKNSAGKDNTKSKGRTSRTQRRKRTSVKAVLLVPQGIDISEPPLTATPLSAEKLEHFRELLMDKRRDLVGDVDSMEAEALRKSRLESAGDLSSMPIHMADIGTDNFEQEFALGLMESERKLLVDITRALNKIDTGVYGICEGTGQAIPEARLEAVPWTRYCIQYQEMVEKGLVEEGERLWEYEQQTVREETEENSDEIDEDIAKGGIDEDVSEDDEDDEDLEEAEKQEVFSEFFDQDDDEDEEELDGFEIFDEDDEKV